MKQSASAYFPFVNDNTNNCLLRSFTAEDTVSSAIRCFLLTKKGSRLGNKVGSIVSNLKYQLIRDSDLPNLGEEIRKELVSQFNGITFLKVDLSKDLSGGTSNLLINIYFSVYNQSNIFDLTITLPSTFSAA